VKFKPTFKIIIVWYFLTNLFFFVVDLLYNCFRGICKPINEILKLFMSILNPFSIIARITYQIKSADLAGFSFSLLLIFGSFLICLIFEFGSYFKKYVVHKRGRRTRRKIWKKTRR